MDKKYDLVDLVFLGVAMGMIVTIFVIMSAFLKMHLGLVSQNSTTIENLERDRSGPSLVSYDHGVEFNWSQVMGKNKFLWWVPYIGEAGTSIIAKSIGGPNGDGVVFPKHEVSSSRSSIGGVFRDIPGKH